MTKTNELSIKGMYCAACSSRIEKVVSKMDGVTDVSVNLATETGRMTYNEKKITKQAIIHKINQLGFQAKIPETYRNIDKDRRDDIQGLQRKFILSFLLTIPLAWAMLAHFKWISFVSIPPLLLNPYVQFVITFPIQFIIGYTFYERAWNAIKSGSTNMDVLVVISTTAAFFYSHFVTFTVPFSIHMTEHVFLYYETSAFIITFILLGRLLEAKTKWKTTEALDKLYDIQTKTATVYENGNEVIMTVEQLHPGQTILIKPGEKVPIDGKVIGGSSFVDESLLTGESVPVEKKRDTLVYAGTLNENGLLKVRVTTSYTNTTLSHIIKIVEDAQVSQAPIQQFANKLTGIFVPIVLGIAMLTFSSWYLFIEPGYFNGALIKVIAVLIVACPCALGLATPTSMMVGSGRAAQLGVLFKEGKFIELLGKCNVICLDKTGTITSGHPVVTDIYIDNKFDSNYVMDMITTIEQMSDHPVAKALVEQMNVKNRSLPTPKLIENMPGYGIKARINNKQIIIASPTYFQQKKLSIPIKYKEQIDTFKKEGKSIIIVAIDERFAAVFALFDVIKQTSINAVTHLKQMGRDVVLLTGDHDESGRRVAKKLGISRVYTECNPVEKVDIIKQLKKDGNRVVMVGDGINDAPALTIADIGIAIGTGSDIAIESGDITIITDDLTRAVDAIKLSKKTMVNIKQNFLWAFLYNIIMIPIAMVGILLPWFAGAAMAFSSIAVVLNSLRLKRAKL